MLVETAVVRKDSNQNYLILFTDRVSVVDYTCPAFACLSASHRVENFGGYSECEISRGTYLQHTSEISIEEAVRVVDDYRTYTMNCKYFFPATRWKRK